MRPAGVFHIFSLLAVVFTCSAAPLDELASYTEFKNVDPEKLGRTVLYQRGKLMNLQDGLMTETCYVVRVPVEKTAKILSGWDATNHAELGVYINSTFNNPVKPADFDLLRIDGKKPAIERLLKSSSSANPQSDSLNLSRAECELLQKARAGASNNKAQLAAALAEAWKKIIFNRSQIFQEKGMNSLPPYELGGKIVKPGEYFLTLLSEQPRITNQFVELLREMPLQTGIRTTNPTKFYWGLFSADSEGTLHAGAVFSKKFENKYQVADVEYFVSNTYYLSLTLYNIWPITINGKPASLVWRADFFAAPTLSFTRGIERMAYAAVMIQEIKKAIRCFQDDAEGTKR